MQYRCWEQERQLTWGERRALTNFTVMSWVQTPFAQSTLALPHSIHGQQSPHHQAKILWQIQHVLSSSSGYWILSKDCLHDSFDELPTPTGLKAKNSTYKPLLSVEMDDCSDEKVEVGSIGFMASEGSGRLQCSIQAWPFIQFFKAGKNLPKPLVDELGASELSNG